MTNTAVPRPASLRTVRAIIGRGSIEGPLLIAKLAGHTLVDTGAHLPGWADRLDYAWIALRQAGFTVETVEDAPGTLIVTVAGY